MLVMLFHLGGNLAKDKYFGAHAFDAPFSFGDAGVEFFFVLSGFIIAWVHANQFGKPHLFLPYVRKRLVRVLPTYWIVFAAVYVVAALFPSLRDSVLLDPGTLMRSLLLLPQDPAVVGGTGAPVLVVAWSLQYEMAFYAVVGLCVLSPLLGIVVVGGLLANAAWCLDGKCTFPQSFFASNLVVPFALGVAVAYICRHTSIRRPRVLVAGGVLLFLAAGICEATIGRDFWWRFTDRTLIYGLCSALIVLGAVKAEDAGLLRLDSRRLQLLGSASYALYLIHFPLISVLCKVAYAAGLRGVIGAAISAPIIVVLCILSAIAFHLKVEQPLLKLLSARGRNSRGTMDGKAPVGSA